MTVDVVFPANKAVVPAAVWYGIDPIKPPAIFVAVVAVPDKLPTTVVAVKDVKPVTEVTVPPKVIVVLPKVVVLLANLLFAIAVPLHTPEVIVPTLVKLDVTTLLAKVVPVNVFASAATVISALPSNATPLMFLVAANFVAVLALPVNAPVNPVEVTEVNPVTEVTVPPRVIVVLPKVVELFANCAFVIAAFEARFEVVNPVTEIVPEEREIPEPAVSPS